MDGHRQQKRRPADFGLKKDFLTSMPSEIIENILVKLPLKEAVRTSVLSRKWKNLWASIPDLVFEGDITESAVDKVLLVHQGPICKFELLCDQHVSEEAINRWLLILSKSGLKDLRLIFDVDKDCKVPSSLFSCHKLERLTISQCIINAPQSFQGLKLLRNLTLAVCHLEGFTIEKFVSGCPLLESLRLFGVVMQDSLVIRAPNLKQLDLFETFNDLLLETPQLVSATIKAYDLPHGFQGPANDGCNCNLLRTISALSNVEELNTDSEFCEYLATGIIPERLQVTFHHLKKISIHLDDRSKVFDTVLCIFRNAPNLKALSLTLPGQNIWEQRITTISFLKQLEVVEILAYEEVGSLLAFAKFILSTAPQLEKLVIYEWKKSNGLADSVGFLMKLVSLPRLSSKAVIVFD